MEWFINVTLKEPDTVREYLKVLILVRSLRPVPVPVRTGTACCYLRRRAKARKAMDRIRPDPRDPSQPVVPRRSYFCKRFIFFTGMYRY